MLHLSSTANAQPMFTPSTARQSCRWFFQVQLASDSPADTSVALSLNVRTHRGRNCNGRSLLEPSVSRHLRDWRATDLRNSSGQHSRSMPPHQYGEYYPGSCALGHTYIARRVVIAQESRSWPCQEEEQRLRRHRLRLPVQHLDLDLRCISLNI